MKKTSSKREAQMAHFQKRCLERLGIELSQKKLRTMIGTPQLPFVARQSNRVSLFSYFHNGTNWILPYDKERHVFITVIHSDSYNCTEDAIRSMLKKDKKDYAVRLLVEQGYDWNSAHEYIESVILADHD
jgi:hypothetical protein